MSYHFFLFFYVHAILSTMLTKNYQTMAFTYYFFSHSKKLFSLNNLLHKVTVSTVLDSQAKVHLTIQFFDIYHNQPLFQMMFTYTNRFSHAYCNPPACHVGITHMCTKGLLIH